MAAKESSIATLVSAGARILETACGFPASARGEGAPPSNGVSVRTNNRNFEAGPERKDARIFLSPPRRRRRAALKGEMARSQDVAAGSGRVPGCEGAEEVPHRRLGRFSPPTRRKASRSRSGAGRTSRPPESAPLPEGDPRHGHAESGRQDHHGPHRARRVHGSNARSNTPRKYAEFVFEGSIRRSASGRWRTRRRVPQRDRRWALLRARVPPQEHAAICPSYLDVEAVVASRSSGSTPRT